MNKAVRSIQEGKIMPISEATVLHGKILIVDDHEENVKLLDKILRSAGYVSVASTINPLEVCELHAKNRYDLILLDLKMLDMDGYAVMDGLKEIEANNYLPVLVITAHKDNEIQALKAGARDFISKPFEVAEVLARAHNLLEVGMLFKELQNKENAAEAATLAKSQFLANMSHELRTPLNAIIGYSEILAEDAAETADQQSLNDLEKIQGAGRHLLSLINDILDLSKVEAGKMELATEVVKVREMIDEVVATMRPAIEKNQNSLEVDCDEAVGEMHTDPQKLRQILYNLLSNAAKFTNEGRVDFVVTRSGQGGTAMLQFAVRDSGIGIDPVQMARLFQPFMQGDASTTRSYGGTGLGLVISRCLADLLGGDLQVQCDADEGTVFTLLLPAQLPDSAKQSGR
jgi:signal transduction histidine kinase